MTFILYLGTASSCEKNDFLKEIELMKKISRNNNPHIVNMLGAVTLQEPMMLVTEFVVYGDLLSYLKACRKKVQWMNGWTNEHLDKWTDRYIINSFNGHNFFSFSE